MPKVSIVVPVYKAEKYIGRCIESVQKQTLTDWDLILVDDCGGDASMAIVKNYASKDNRIRYIESEKNVGPMVAREKGYKIATGKFLFFLDSDDTLPDSALEILVKTAMDFNSDIVVGQMKLVLEDGSNLPFDLSAPPGIMEKKDIYERLLEGSFPHNLCGKLFKGSLLKPESLSNFEGLKNGEDGYLFLQILEKVNIVRGIPDFVYYYWINNTSSTHKPITQETLNGIVKFEKYKYKILSHHLENIDKRYLEYLHIFLSELAKKCPYKLIEEAFNREGFVVNFDFFSLLRLLPIKIALKVFFKAKCYQIFKHYTCYN